MKQELKLEIPSFKIFDFHRHISKNLGDFQNNLINFNIDRFCLMPSMIEGDFQDLESYINKIKLYIQKYDQRAIIFGFLDFSQDSEKNIELLNTQKKELSIKGIKIHPEQGFIIDKQYLLPYFKAVNEILGINAPIYVHMDWPLLKENRYAPQGKKNTFNKLVSYFPEFRFIMGHAGGSGDYLNIWKSCKSFSC